MSTLQPRSLAEFRKRGYIVSSVERRKRFPDPKRNPCPVCHRPYLIDISSDLWECFDVIAVRPITPARSFSVALVQVTDRSNHSKRRTKIIGSAEAKFCVMAGIGLCIQSWRKNKQTNRWEFVDEWVTLDMFDRSLPDTVEGLYEQRQKANLPALPVGSTLFPVDVEEPF